MYIFKLTFELGLLSGSTMIHGELTITITIQTIFICMLIGYLVEKDYEKEAH
jgi:hypothetical protein